MKNKCRGKKNFHCSFSFLISMDPDHDSLDTSALSDAASQDSEPEDGLTESTTLGQGDHENDNGVDDSPTTSTAHEVHEGDHENDNEVTAEEGADTASPAEPKAKKAIGRMTVLELRQELKSLSVSQKVTVAATFTI